MNYFKELYSEYIKVDGKVVITDNDLNTPALAVTQNGNSTAIKGDSLSDYWLDSGVFGIGRNGATGVTGYNYGNGYGVYARSLDAAALYLESVNDIVVEGKNYNNTHPLIKLGNATHAKAYEVENNGKIFGYYYDDTNEYLLKNTINGKIEKSNIKVSDLSSAKHKEYQIWNANESFNCQWPDPDWWNGHVFPVSFALPYAGTFNFSFRLHLQSIGVKGAYPMEWMFTDDLDPLTSKTTFMVGDYHHSGTQTTASTTRSTMLDLNAIHPRGTGILSTNVLGNGSLDGENTVLLINGNITVTGAATIQMYGRSLDPLDTSWNGNILRGSFFRIEEI